MFMLGAFNFDSKHCAAGSAINPIARAFDHKSVFQSYARDTRQDTLSLSICIITGSIHSETFREKYYYFLRKSDYFLKKYDFPKKSYLVSFALHNRS